MIDPVGALDKINRVLSWDFSSMFNNLERRREFKEVYEGVTGSKIQKTCFNCYQSKWDNLQKIKTAILITMAKKKNETEETKVVKGMEKYTFADKKRTTFVHKGVAYTRETLSDEMIEELLERDDSYATIFKEVKQRELLEDVKPKNKGGRPPKTDNNGGGDANKNSGSDNPTKDQDQGTGEKKKDPEPTKDQDQSDRRTADKSQGKESSTKK